MSFRCAAVVEHRNRVTQTAYKWRENSGRDMMVRTHWCNSWGIWGYKHKTIKVDVWSTSTRELEEDDVTSKLVTEMMLDVLLLENYGQIYTEDIMKWTQLPWSMKMMINATTIKYHTLYVSQRELWRSVLYNGKA